MKITKIKITEVMIWLFPLITLGLFIGFYLYPETVKIREREQELLNSRKMLLQRPLSNAPNTVIARIDRLEKEHDTLLNDVRQETNNNIDKANLWLTLWLAVIAIFGGFLPILIQYRLYLVNREKLEQEIGEFRDFLKIHAVHNIVDNFMALRESDILKESEMKSVLMGNFISELTDTYREIVQSISESYNGILSPSALNSLIQILLQISVICSYVGRSVPRLHKRQFDSINDNVKVTLSKLINIGNNKKSEDIVNDKDVLLRLQYLTLSLRSLSSCLP